MKILAMYLAVINSIGFFIMGLDKAKAKAHQWRIAERTLFAVAFAGGGLGMWLGMEIFRHKTRHWYFKYGIPAICLMEIAVLLFLHMKVS